MFDETIKKRLIGAIVLIAIAVIFFPMLFDVHHSEGVLDMAEMPERPVFEKVSFEVAQTPLNDEEIKDLKSQEMTSTQNISDAELKLQEAKILEPVVTINKDKSANVKQDKVDSSLVLLDSEGMPKVWSLQVATFGERVNAHALQSRLKGLGYKAYVRKHDKQALYKVYVGPQLELAVMRKAKTTISETLGLNGIVVRYIP